jgi:hypothetical protein
MNLLLKFPSVTDEKTCFKYLELDFQSQSTVKYDELVERIETDFDLECEEYILVSRNGIQLKSNSFLNHGDVIQLCPKVLGGKGGFGSLLRSFGKQITKSTNKDACRDLSGRRMKHVNNEKRLQEFMTKQAELAKEKEQKKKEKSERRRHKIEQFESGATGTHLFLDPKYDQDRQKINNDLEEAIGKAMKTDRLKHKTKQSSSGKNQEETTSSSESNSSNENQIESANSENSENSMSETPLKITSSKNAQTAIKIVVPSTTLSDSKKTKDIATTKFKDWLGVGDIEVSSGSDSDEVDEQPNKSKKQT